MKKILLLSLIISCSIQAYADKKVYEAKYSDSTAAITVDGYLTDWEYIGANRETLGNYITISNDMIEAIDIMPSSPDNLSTWFMCVADKNGVYVAIHVTDDIVVTDNHGFPDGWKDDSIDICFDGDLKDLAGKTGFDANDGQVGVIGGKEGFKWMSGYTPGLTAQIPYYWEARGIRAGYLQIPGGYSVELMIPADILGYDSISGGTRIGLNIRVLENDDAAAGANGTTHGILSWAYDPKAETYYRTELYNQILFTTKMDSLVSAVPDVKTAAVSLGERELLVKVGITEANQNETMRIMKGVSEKLFSRDWDGAAEAMSPVKDQLWAKCITGYLALQRKDYKNGLRLLDEFGKNSGDKAISEWTRSCPVEYGSYGDHYGGLNRAEVAYLMNEYIRINPADTTAIKVLLRSLKNINTSDDITINILNTLYQEAMSEFIADYAQLSLAKCYFSKGDYKNSTELLNKVSKSSNTEIYSNSQMMLILIDKELSKKER
jgi:hypothetical protein